MRRTKQWSSGWEVLLDKVPSLGTGTKDRLLASDFRPVHRMCLQSNRNGKYDSCCKIICDNISFRKSTSYSRTAVPFDLARGSEISRIQSPTLTVSMVKDFAGEEDVKIELGTKTDPYQTPAALVKKRKEYSVLQTSD